MRNLLFSMFLNKKLEKDYGVIDDYKTWLCKWELSSSKPEVAYFLFVRRNILQ